MLMTEEIEKSLKEDELGAYRNVIAIIASMLRKELINPPSGYATMKVNLPTREQKLLN